MKNLVKEILRDVFWFADMMGTTILAVCLGLVFVTFIVPLTVMAKLEEWSRK